MTNSNKMIKTSAILYLISSLLIIPYVIPLGGLLLTLGTLLLSYSFLNEEELNRKKVPLILIAIISFILNLPAAVFIIIAVSDVSSEKQINNNSPPISSESKRIDLLLKLGLGMILISGILFATTSWEIISNLVKVIFLIIMGLIFLGLSVFSEKKLKIESTTKAYFILGLAFFLLTWIGIGYFGVFSEWFSYTGSGNNLVYFITFIILALMLYLISIKFKEKEYLYLGHISIYLSIYHILSFIGLDLLQVTLVLSIISLVINLLPNIKCLEPIKATNNTISYLYCAIILTQCFKSTELIVLLTCIINIISLLTICIKSKNAVDNIMSIVISYILILIGVLKLTLSFDKAFILFVVIALFSLLVKYNKISQEKTLIITSQVIYNIISTIIIIYLATYSPLYLLLSSLIYIIINILNSLDLYKINDQVDYRYQPIVIFIMFMSLIHFININIIYTGELLAFALTTLTYVLIYHFSKTEKTKKYYFIFLIISIIFTYLLNFNYLEIISAIALLLTGIYLFFTRKKEDTVPRIISYIFILLMIIQLVESTGLFGIASTMNNLIVLIIFGILTLLVKDSKLKKVNYLAIIYPLYYLVNSFELERSLNLIVNNIFHLYIVFLIIKLIIKDKNIRDIIGTIGISLVIIEVIMITDLLIGLYIGIIGIILIFLTFNESSYKKMFYTGIIITIINIVIQLWEFWTQIPFWLYLLLVGIAIIAFVTYKETKKKEVPQPDINTNKEIKQEILENELPEEKALQLPLTAEPRQAKVEEKETLQTTPQPRNTQLEVARFCPICGTSNSGGNFCRKCGKNLKLK